MRERTLYVPSDVSLRNEVWPGFSVKDAIISLGVSIVSIGLFAVLSAVFGLPLLACVLGVLLSGVAAVGLLSRMPEINRSILDQIAIVLAFERSQKDYYYVYRRKV